MNTEQEQNVRDQVVSLLRLPEVERRCGIKRSTILKLMALPEGTPGKFPQHVQLTGPRSVAWPSNLVAAWIEARIAASYPKTSAPSAVEARA